MINMLSRHTPIDQIEISNENITSIIFVGQIERINFGNSVIERQKRIFI